MECRHSRCKKRGLHGPVFIPDIITGEYHDPSFYCDEHYALLERLRRDIGNGD